MKKIFLDQTCGEFCTERTHPGLPALQDAVLHAIQSSEPLTIHIEKVKILSASFLDELVTPLFKKGIRWSEFQKTVTFCFELNALQESVLKRRLIK